MPRITPERVLTSLILFVIAIVALVNHQFVTDVTHASFLSSNALSSELSDRLNNYSPRVPSAELQARLKKFLSAPLLKYSDALAQNLQTCGTLERANRQVNPDQLRKQKIFWKGQGNVDLAKRRLQIVQYLEDMATLGKLIPEPRGGRGIVMTAGNKVRNNP